MQRRDDALRDGAGRSPGILSLVPEIDRHGEAIEYDLHHELGLDLLDWFRGGHPWGKLRRILARLPESSRYVASLRDDPDRAERALATPPRRWRPPAAEWSLDRELLAGVRDRLDQVIAVLHDLPVADGVKRRTKPPETFPRPLTAIDRARAAADARLESALDELIDAAHATYAAESGEPMDQ